MENTNIRHGERVNDETNISSCAIIKPARTLPMWVVFAQKKLPRRTFFAILRYRICGRHTGKLKEIIGQCLAVSRTATFSSLGRRSRLPWRYTGGGAPTVYTFPRCQDAVKTGVHLPVRNPPQAEDTTQINAVVLVFTPQSSY